MRHGRYVTLQMAEVAVPRNLFRKILNLIDEAAFASVGQKPQTKPDVSWDRWGTKAKSRSVSE